MRAATHVAEASGPGAEVSVQIAAIRAALNGVGQAILEDHLKTCRVRAVEQDEFERALVDLSRSLDQLIG